MEKMTLKEIKRLAKYGHATDLTNAREKKELPEGFTRIGYSEGIYGLNGLLMKGDDTGNLYAITSRTAALWIFG